MCSHLGIPLIVLNAMQMCNKKVLKCLLFLSHFTNVVVSYIND